MRCCIVQTTQQISPELADAADVLSDQLRVHLQRLAVLLEPHADQDRPEISGPPAAARISSPSRERPWPRSRPAPRRAFWRSGQPPLKFIEQVEYNGRRLAKLNLPPSAILEALQEYDRLLTPMLESLLPDEHANFQWVREQLHFCVILTLNNAYYQVREAETQAFYELFRIELESRNLEELLRRFLESLVHVCQRRRRPAVHAERGRHGVGAAGRRRRKPAALSVPNRPGLVQEALEAALPERRRRIRRTSCSIRAMAQALRLLLVDSSGHRRAHRRRDAVRLLRSPTNGCRANRNCWPRPPSAA